LILNKTHGGKDYESFAMIAMIKEDINVKKRKELHVETCFPYLMKWIEMDSQMVEF